MAEVMGYARIMELDAREHRAAAERLRSSRG